MSEQYTRQPEPTMKAKIKAFAILFFVSLIAIPVIGLFCGLVWWLFKIGFDLL
jgi:hypothetical protein